MVKNEGHRLTRFIVCTPGNEYFNVKDYKMQNFNEPADQIKTVEQHDRLKSIMNQFGS